MERAQNGDRAAFQSLFEEVGPLVIRFLRRRLTDETEAEDVCQEVLIAVYRSRHTYQSDRPFEPWLFAIARKVAGEHLRRHRQHFGFQVLAEELPEIRVGDGSGLSVELGEALEQLSPAQIEAVTLTKVLGLSVEDASRRAGTNVASMKVRVHRAYESLKRSLIR
jgi:RNA polymerase sigma-70 factor (ECF subfamily)